MSIEEWRLTFKHHPKIVNCKTKKAKLMKEYLNSDKDKADAVLELGARLAISEPRRLFGICEK